jgi:glycosyltransferase involved in cell wall biosynthesis
MDRVISISDAVTSFAQSKLGCDSAQIQRIYYGIDPSQYPSDRPRQPGTQKVAIVARLAAQSGHHLLLDAMRTVVARLPTASLLVIGHEDDITVAELSSYALEKGLRGHVDFLGFRADIANLLQDVDLFVLPSLWEGFGLVLIEAMALGVPVVASRIGPIPEIVIDGETGTLVSPGNADDLARGIIDLLEDPARALAYSQAGRARVETQFSVQAMVAQYEQLYAELTSSQFGARAA